MLIVLLDWNWDELGFGSGSHSVRICMTGSQSCKAYHFVCYRPTRQDTHTSIPTTIPMPNRRWNFILLLRPVMYEIIVIFIATEMRTKDGHGQQPFTFTNLLPSSSRDVIVPRLRSALAYNSYFHVKTLW